MSGSGFLSDCRSIHGMRLASRYSKDEEGFFEVIADRFMEMEVIILKWLSLISFIVF